MEQVGGEQEPDSALFKKIQAERKHPADRIYTHRTQPSAGSPESEMGYFLSLVLSKNVFFMSIQSANGCKLNNRSFGGALRK